MMRDEVDIQRRYYASTASKYDAAHVHSDDEHSFALAWLRSVIDHYRIESVLDVGSGTGRVPLYLKNQCPRVRILGIEPVEALRTVGWSKGLPEEELVAGDATALALDDAAFDMTCAFGLLHHVRDPSAVLHEMLRVGKKAIFISDCNNFGIGPWWKRGAKQLFSALGLWSVVDFLKTHGKGYHVSEGDGVAYSYSVFSSYRLIHSRCSAVHVLNTAGTGVNPYRSASHVALLGIIK